MRTLNLSVEVGPKYHPAYTETRPIARVALAENDERETTADDILMALAEPFTKVMFAGCIAGAQTLATTTGIEAAESNDQQFLIMLKVWADKDTAHSYGEPLKVTEVSLVANSYCIKGVDQEVLARNLGRVTAGAVALIVDLLVANGLSKALPSVATGSEAEELAKLAEQSRTAWDVAQQIQVAIHDREQAETSVAQARARLAEVMAAMEPAA